MKWGFLALLVVALFYLSYLRTDFFSPDSLSTPLFFLTAEDPSSEVEAALLQPYRYLNKGRQTYVFVSQDGKTVVKFFNERYLKTPWYAKWLPLEKKKRALRQRYYEESYPMSSTEDAAILYLHLGRSEKALPSLKIVDRASRLFNIDLNYVSFVVQKKGEPLYKALEEIYVSEGKQGFDEAIEQFVSLIGRRIEKNIADADHDVEHNFGWIDGKVFHLDPGRLFFRQDLLEPDVLRQQWWGCTHRFRQWLVQNHPESVSVLDRAIDEESVRVKSL